MRSAKSPFNNGDRGFSLIEVMIATGLLAIVALGVAQLFAASTMTNLGAKGETSAVALANQKMEQLRALTWGFDQDQAALGLPASDTVTNLAVDPPTTAGGGLNPSPGGSLDANTAGYVDFLDANGKWVGTGATAPGNAAYVRRWAIEPLPTNPNNTLIFQVVVTTVAAESRRAAANLSGPRRRLPGDAWILSVKTRKAS